MTEELGPPFKRGGAVTLRRRKLRRSLKPDRCYWIGNAAKMRGVRRLDLRIHPPPDLAIEVEVARRALNRLAIYARLRVPEVWRLDGPAMTFHVLQADGSYAIATHSRAFPMVTPSDLPGFLGMVATTDEHVITAQFRQWVRQRLA
ncbi:MAG: Uma2 family endonuclease [Gemmataceae bacterium]